MDEIPRWVANLAARLLGTVDQDLLYAPGPHYECEQGHVMPVYVRGEPEPPDGRQRMHCAFRTPDTEPRCRRGVRPVDKARDLRDPEHWWPVWDVLVSQGYRLIRHEMQGEKQFITLQAPLLLLQRRDYLMGSGHAATFTEAVVRAAAALNQVPCDDG